MLGYACTVYASERLSRSSSKNRPPSPLATPASSAAAQRSSSSRSGAGKASASAVCAFSRSSATVTGLAGHVGGASEVPWPRVRAPKRDAAIDASVAGSMSPTSTIAVAPRRTRARCHARNCSTSTAASVCS